MSRRTRLEPERGDGQTKMLATAVVVLLTAAVVALLVVNFSRDISGAGTTRDHGAEGQRITASASSTPAAAPSVPSRPITSPVRTSPTAKPSSSVAALATSRPPAARKPVTYVVKRGDNLTVIAAWFHQHGYGALYEWNRSVIGDNPDLIHPGQRITISGADMTVSR